MTLTRHGLAVLLGLLLTAAAWAAPDFPALTGRVVDNANLLTPAQEQALTEKLAAEEQQTSNQVVVVTLPDLQGYAIEDYGYQLGREWGIGQEGKDNGVLLIIAPNERRIRIEVGYGLEGALTDALSSVIIQREIRPAFRAGDFAGGINAGVDAIRAAIAGEYQAEPAKKDTGQLGTALIYLMVLVFITIFLGLGALGGGGRGGRGGGAVFLPMGGGFGGGGGGGFGGGGFGGGGGGFGGGGASGGW
ncbi:TPM domain-containing protein [Alcanivorax marinus]|uniref:TPM domain-containing protein n=1 Tax=Alloalcanivorax marinus TaxID=1177169 RepID=A0A9Q3UHZ3_9GAMM|nr:TPM domain-containing protein [Alloalcanivorax marinus]MCC4307332.1 TPM domain-containing protein [Alloalcanivorax marinus]